MADNLSVTISADASQLRAQLAVAQSELRAFTREMNAAANAARQNGSELALARVGQAAANVNTATASVAKLKDELGELAGHTKETESLNETFRLMPGVVLRAREGLSGLKETAEAVGAAFAVEHVLEWSHQVAETGEHTANLAETLGTSAEEMSGLQGAMQLAGGEAAKMERALLVLEQRMREALHNPTGPTADAFADIGISVEDLKRGLADLPGFMRRVADAWQQMGPGGQRTADFEKIFGLRTLTDMVKLLADGSRGLDQLVQKAKDFNAAQPKEWIEAEKKSVEVMHELDAAWTGFKNNVLGSAGLFDDVYRGLTNLLQTLQGKIDLSDLKADLGKFAARPGETADERNNRVLNQTIGRALGNPEIFGARAPAGDLVPGGAVSGAVQEGVERFSIRPGVRTDAGLEPVLADLGARASAALPEGYRVVMTSGYRPQGSNSPVGRHSQHALGLAGDFEIIGPQGPIPNEGQDVTGLYGRFNQAFEANVERFYPQLAPYHRFGGEFGSRGGPISPSSPADLMHQDFRGYRGPPIPVAERGAPSFYITAGAASPAAEATAGGASGLTGVGGVLAPAGRPEPQPAEGPRGGALPSAEFSTQAAERMLEADFARKEQEARFRNDFAALQRIQDERNRLATQRIENPDAYNATLQQRFPNARAGAEQTIRGAETSDRIRQEQQEYDLHTRLAQLTQQEDDARRRHDYASVAQIEQQKAQLIDADAHSTAAQRIEAETQVRAAQYQTSRQAIEQAQQAYQAQSRADQDILRATRTNIATRVERGDITRSQGIQQEASALNEVTQREEQALQKLMEMANATGDNTEKTKIYWQQWELGVKKLEEVQRLQKEIADDAKKTAAAWGEPFKQALGSVGGSLESTLAALITKTETAAKAWRSFYQSAVKAGIDMVGSLLSKVAGAALGGKEGQGIGDVITNKIGSFIGNKVGGLFGLGDNAAQTTLQVQANAQLTAHTALLSTIAGNTAATAAGTTAGAATSAAGSVTGGVISGGGSFLGRIFGGASTGGGLFGLGFLGLSRGGIVPAASRGGIVMPRAARGWVVPAAAGGWSLPGFGSDTVPTMLTPGEMVLPTKISGGLQHLINSGAAGGSGGDLHVHLGAGATFLDGPSFQRWFLQQGGKQMIADTIRGAFRSNALQPFKL